MAVIEREGGPMGLVERVVRRIFGARMPRGFGQPSWIALRRRVRDEADVAAWVAATGDREAAAIEAAQLRELLDMGETTLHLSIDRRPPFRLEIVPTTRHRVRLRTQQGTLAARVEEPAPDAAWIRPGFRRVPALHHERRSEGSVIVFSVEGGRGWRFRLLVPAHLTHATVVLNGRVRLRAEPMGWLPRPRVLHVR